MTTPRRNSSRALVAGGILALGLASVVPGQTAERPDENPQRPTAQQYIDDLNLPAGVTDPKTHLDSLKASARLKDLSPEQLRAGMPVIVRALGGDNPVVADRCAQALGRAGDEGAAAVIAFVKTRLGPDPRRLDQCAGLLSSLGPQHGTAIARLITEQDTVTAGVGIGAIANFVRRQQAKSLSPEAMDLIRRAIPRIKRFAELRYATGKLGDTMKRDADAVLSGVGPGGAMADAATRDDLARGAGQGDADYARQLGRQLDSPLVAVRRKAIQSLVDLGPVATPELVKALNDSQDYPRELALTALLRFYHPDADDTRRSPDRRASDAADGRRPHGQKPGWPAPLEGANLEALRGAVPALTAMRSDGTRRVRLLAVIAPFDPKAADALAALARDRKPGHAGQVDEQELVDALALAGPSVRPALEALAKLALPPEPTATARERDSGQGAPTRVANAALTRMAVTAPRPAEGGKEDPETLRRLVRAAGGGESNSMAVAALRARGDDAVPAILDAYFAATQYYARERYAKLLAGSNNRVAIDGLSKRLNAGPEQRSYAADLLSKIGPNAGPVFTAMLASPNVADRRTGATSLYQMGPLLAKGTPAQQKEFVEALAKAVRDPDDSVRANAASALGRMGGRASTASRPLPGIPMCKCAGSR